MAKLIRCDKVNPSGDCKEVIRGKDEREVLRKAADHAKQHGLQPTPELMSKVKSCIEDEAA